jgi:hypothetical protein
MPRRSTISRQRRLTCGFFEADKFEHFAGLVQSYAFSEAYEELMAVGERAGKRASV